MEGDWGAGAIFRPGAYLVEVCEQMCTCPTRAPQDSCLASGSRVEQPLIRASAPSIQLSLSRMPGILCPHRPHPLPPLDILSSHQAFATVAPGN